MNIVAALFILLCALAAPISPQAGEQPTAQHSPLVFEPAQTDLGTIPEGKKAVTYLRVRNSSDQMQQIIDIQASCGCTTAEPETRLIMPGDFTRIKVTIDTFAKQNHVQKRITLTDAHGLSSEATLTMRITRSPHAAIGNRSIFDAPCARCHAEPAQGKTEGAALFAAVCAMCHGKQAEGASGPNLHHHARQALQQIITHGTGNHYMPAFARRYGGPLTTEQIAAISRWLAALDE